MLSRIYLIRHGKTEGNHKHWYYGATDLPLSETGLAEIRAYAEKGIYPEIPGDTDFYTTGLVRTDQTLEAIYGSHEHTAIPRLQEINFGKAECMTYDDLKVFDNFDKWAWDTTGDERIADAETANEFHARIHEGLKELLERHHQKEQACRKSGRDAVSVIVCHGGVIACIMEKLFPAVCGSMWDWLPEPGFGYIVDLEDGEPYMYSKINDIGRLGLGIYRLPMAGKNRIDHKKTKDLFDVQMKKSRGFFEIDFLDGGSLGGIPEDRAFKAVREDFVRRYDRTDINLTAVVDIDRISEARRMIRLMGAGYLDRLAVSGVERYVDVSDDPALDHEALSDKRIIGPGEISGDMPVESEKVQNVWKCLGELKKKGLVKKAGLAFAGSPALLDILLKDHQEIDYVVLPVNCIMGFGDADLAQKYYTISRRRYKEILVRSPFAGGKLADPSREARAVLGLDDTDEKEQADVGYDQFRHTMAGYAMLKKQNAPHSAVDWALRYVLSFPFVVTCVAASGDPDHVAENVDAADRFRPLTEEERKLLKKAAAALI